MGYLKNALCYPLDFLHGGILWWGAFKDDTFKNIRACGPAQLTYQLKVKIWDNFSNFWLIGLKFCIWSIWQISLAAENEDAVGGTFPS